jgi:hypothetical protein
MDKYTDVKDTILAYLRYYSKVYKVEVKKVKKTGLRAGIQTMELSNSERGFKNNNRMYEDVMVMMI